MTDLRKENIVEGMEEKHYLVMPLYIWKRYRQWCLLLQGRSGFKQQRETADYNRRQVSSRKGGVNLSTRTYENAIDNEIQKRCEIVFWADELIFWGDLTNSWVTLFYNSIIFLGEFRVSLSHKIQILYLILGEILCAVNVYVGKYK